MDDLSCVLHHQAIAAALSANWELAIKLNQEILESDPENIDALNRLARSYFELGEIKLAKKYYAKSLKSDPYNQIASKFLKRIETFSKKAGKKFKVGENFSSQVSSDLFIEEPGKTRLVTLLKLAEPHKLSLLSPGNPVNLIIKNRGIGVTDQNGEYLGVLPDDLSHRLTKLINGGNKYQAFIKSIKFNSLSILIKEVFRSSRFKNQPSFLESTNVIQAYSSDHIIVPNESEDEVVEETEEETL